MQNTNLPWRIYKTTDKYFNYGKKGYSFCDIGLMLYNLSEHQIEALSNLLRGNDCNISQPTGSGKSAVTALYISLYFLSLLYEAFQLLYRSNDVYVEPKTQEIVISNM
jgi:replicative superfamily II helicase